MLALLTDQETAAAETALCNRCYRAVENKAFARHQAGQADDIDAYGDFHVYSDNEALACCICGIQTREENPMDPEANKREQRELAEDILTIWDDCGHDGELNARQLVEMSHSAQRLAELVLALAEWESKQR